MDPVQRRGPWTPGPCFVLTHQLSGTRAVVTIAREHSRISGLLSARKSLPRSRFWMSRNAPRKQTARTMRKECSSDRMSAAVLFGERCVTFKKRLRGRLSIDKRQWSASDNWVILVPRARRFFWSGGLVRVIELTPVTFVLFFQKKLKLKLKLAMFGKFEGS